MDDWIRSVENPKVAVVTVIMQGGTSTNNGPMTRDIMAEALKLKHDKDKNKKILRVRMICMKTVLVNSQLQKRLC